MRHCLRMLEIDSPTISSTNAFTPTTNVEHSIVRNYRVCIETTRSVEHCNDVTFVQNSEGKGWSRSRSVPVLLHDFPKGRHGVLLGNAGSNEMKIQIILLSTIANNKQWGLIIYNSQLAQFSGMEGDDIPHPPQLCTLIGSLHTIVSEVAVCCC